MACTTTMIAALQSENEQLRARLAELDSQVPVGYFCRHPVLGFYEEQMGPSDSNIALYAQPILQKLDKPAQVGNIRFGVGVSIGTVIEAAQRRYEYENTPEKEAARIEKAKAALKEFFSAGKNQQQIIPVFCNSVCDACGDGTGSPCDHEDCPSGRYLGADTDWTDWNGCPIAPVNTSTGTFEFKLRNGQIVDEAKDWSHTGEPDDIIAYRSKAKPDVSPLPIDSEGGHCD